VGRVVSVALFLAWKYHQGDAVVVPWAILRNGIIHATAIMELFNYGIMIVANHYLDIYFQSVMDDTPLENGVHMLLPSSAFCCLW
jgi:hypothetical protein